MTAHSPKRPAALLDLQWQNMTLCADLRCSCGNLVHVDARRVSHIQCRQCKTIFAIETVAELRAVAPEEVDALTPFLTDRSDADTDDPFDPMRA